MRHVPNERTRMNTAVHSSFWCAEILFQYYLTIILTYSHSGKHNLFTVTIIKQFTHLTKPKTKYYRSYRIEDDVCCIDVFIIFEIVPRATAGKRHSRYLRHSIPLMESFFLFDYKSNRNSLFVCWLDENVNNHTTKGRIRPGSAMHVRWTGTMGIQKIGVLLSGRPMQSSTVHRSTVSQNPSNRIVACPISAYVFFCYSYFFCTRSICNLFFQHRHWVICFCFFQDALETIVLPRDGTIQNVRYCFDFCFVNWINWLVMVGKWNSAASPGASMLSSFSIHVRYFGWRVLLFRPHRIFNLFFQNVYRHSVIYFFETQ